ncbi:helix-turn-helix transcriptional regulator [Erwinia mallotivora]|uniref:helix-turn-helix transcriptional regulator n=1 Tax=Erwinia mallotivora TaxID=69222 RepID=UPI0021C1990D|nr:AlpA family transcriptional regulator [Erwinia mallotivora]
MNTATLNTTRLIRLPEVLHKTGYKRAWIYRLISENRFPKPIKLGSRAVAFIEVEIDQWISETISNSRKTQY